MGVKYDKILGSLRDDDADSSGVFSKSDKRYVESMRGWNAAVGSSHNLAAKIVLVGDSITQLFGATISSRILANYNKGVSSKYMRPGVVYGGDWTTFTGTSAQTTHGLGNYGGTLEAATSQEGTVVQTCDGFILYYTKQETGGCSLEIYIDGGLVDTISTTDAGVDVQESGFSWTSSTLQPNMQHTLRVVATGTGTALIDGALYTDNNLLSGVQVFGAGHSGYKISDYIAQESTYEAVNNIDPDLIVIHMGTNDYAQYSGDADLFRADLIEFVQRFKTDNPYASIMLVIPHASFDRSAGNWDAYVQVYKDVAEDEGCAIVDTYAAMGDLGNTYDVYSMSDDQVHPNTIGSKVMADTIVDAIYHYSINRESPPIRQDGTVKLTGELTVASGNKGSIGFGQLFGYPIFATYGDTIDSYAEYWLVGSGLATLLGFTSTIIGWGDGSSGNPDVNIGRPSAGTLGLYGSSSATYGDLLMGSLTANGGSIIDGSANEVQLEVQAHSTQTTKLAKFTNSAGTALISITGTGVIEFGGGSDVNLYKITTDILGTDDDFEITSSSKGVILQSPDTSRWRVTVDNEGALTTTEI